MNFRKLFLRHPKTWIWSDQHFGHRSICRFTKADGVTPLRPWDYVEEMDSILIANHNQTVDSRDCVLFLGDVAMKVSILDSVMPRLTRTKTRILVRGNHDTASHDFYKKYFDFVLTMITINGVCVMTHIPIHPDSIGRYGVNLHGHTHDKHIQDSRYKNVCVENTDYRPILLSPLVGDLTNA